MKMKRKKSHNDGAAMMSAIKRSIVGLPKTAEYMSHYFPHAYCIAKPAPGCAVFVLPPQLNWMTGGIYHNSSDVIHNDSAIQCEVGQWYSIAYCKFQTGAWTVAVPHQPREIPTRNQVVKRKTNQTP
jgi:hypothetical protein